MSSTPALAAEALTTLTGLVKHTSAAPEEPVSATGSRGDSLRTLALLVPVLRLAIDEAAADVASSPVRAAAFLSLVEALYRQAGYGQLLAASRAVDAQVHTITEEPLAQLNAWLAEPEAAATSPLPADVPTPAGTKPFFREDADLLDAQLNLTHFQARHRGLSAENLLPHNGFNGRGVPAKFPLLGQVLSEGAADPKSLAALAKKFEGLGAEAGPVMEAELAEAARTRNTKGTDGLLKDQAKRLRESSAADRESAEDFFVGIDYLGHTSKGFEYKITTTAEGHELLSTAADLLNSPRTRAGTRNGQAPGGNTAAGSRGPQGDRNHPGNRNQPGNQAPGTPMADALPLPDWAAAPGTPMSERPLSGLDEPGATAGNAPFDLLDPATEIRPGESLESALTRQRARRLHQLFLDAMRMMTTSGSDAGQNTHGGTDAAHLRDDQMPLPPHVMLNVTISYDALIGQLDKAGITDHGEDISPATCRRLACIAGIIPIVLSGGDVPLALGRTKRYFNRAQRRAIAVRDKGCINPGCTMKIGRCEAHHIDAWNLGGRTDVDRGCLLCPLCHAAYHAGKFKIRVADGIPYVIQPRSRDPLQLPRRNWIFHPAAPPARAA